MNKVIYLDNNATTKVDERIFEEMKPYFCEKYGNPSSIHAFGGEVSHAVKKARNQVKEMLGAENEREIIFTAGGSESANMAIKGVLDLNKDKKHIITSKVEHPCVLNLYKWLEKRGYRVTYLGVNSEGELDLNELRESVTEDTALVSVMYANNETGVIFPIEQMGEIIKSKNKNTKFFVDAVQAAGKIPINVSDMQIDMLGISGHKIHAPKGVGALYIKKGTMLTPLVMGGHQEFGKRAGTENVTSIIGLGMAADLAVDALKEENTTVKALRDKLEKGLLERIYNARVNGGKANRVPNTSNISFEYIEGELILLHLSDIGICASSGSACTSGSLEPSHVLKAMGIPFTSMHGSVRWSLSRFTTEEEINYVLEHVPDIIINKINKLSPYQQQLEDLKRQKK
mgnify:FL=1